MPEDLRILPTVAELKRVRSTVSSASEEVEDLPVSDEPSGYREAENGAEERGGEWVPDEEAARGKG
jgi:hypothetical protein